MARPSVFVSRVIPDAGLDLLRANFDVDVWPHDRSPSRDELNVVLLPHIGSASVATRSKMAEIAARNVIAFFAGEAPPTALNLEVLGRAAKA